MHKKTFLGIGWKFPPSFDKKMGSVVLVSEEQDIRESILILLSTRPGERLMSPEYGCALSQFTFENMDFTLINEMKSRIEKAILYFEPRVNVAEIQIDQDENIDGLLNISIDYIVRKTNNRSNMVFPYYLIEGTDVKYKPKA